MHLRKLRGVEMPIDGLLESEPFSFVDEIPGRSYPSPLNGVAIERALHTLTAKQQDVFLLHHVGGFTHREISERLGMTVNNSKSRVRRARLEMRDYLWT
jgi:DNA-directed RNA polymerase specialized sigma24 family protein